MVGNKEIGRKGELTSSQIVGIVLVIAGFALILLFIPAISEIFTGQSNEELCRLSVVTRATVPSSAQQLVPLRCSTEKICFSEKGGKDKCGQFAGEDDEEGSDKLNKKTVEENAEVIEREIANEMLDCWRMMGEGKLDLFGDIASTDFSPIPKYEKAYAPRCVVCSRIAVGQDVENKEKVLKEVNLNDFINNKKPTERLPETYSDLFLGVGVGVPEVEKGDIVLSDQVAVIFSQTKVDESYLKTAFKTAGSGFVIYGSTFLTPLGALTKHPVTIALGALGIVGSGVATGIGVKAAQEFAAGYCGEFQSTSKDLKTGCSVVRVMEWTPENVNEINKFCGGGIEGNL